MSDVIARFRAAGLNVEAQPPSSYPAIFGADRVDLGRLTVSYLRTPYYVQVATLLVVITTTYPNVAAAAIDAIT